MGKYKDIDTEDKYGVKTVEIDINGYKLHVEVARLTEEIINELDLDISDNLLDDDQCDIIIARVTSLSLRDVKLLCSTERDKLLSMIACSTKEGSNYVN